MEAILVFLGLLFIAFPVALFLKALFFNDGPAC